MCAVIAEQGWGLTAIQCVGVGMLRAVTVATLLALLAASSPSFAEPREAAPTSGELVTARIEQRIVKVFDFDERTLGNYEDTPMNWLRIVEPGYPRFLEPRFDYDVGHDSPPSFQLALRGGSVAMKYQGRDIPVHPDSDYRIVAWVRTAGLVHARAFVTAWFMDHAMRPIEASERWSEPIGGEGRNDEWQVVAVDLPGGYERAARVGLSVRLQQAGDTQPSTSNPLPIQHRDVTASAWFDDITVLRLPRAALALSKACPIYEANEKVECQTHLSDPDGIGLTAKLEVRDADGRMLSARDVPLGENFDPTTMFDLGEQPPGLHVARLTVTIEAQELAAQERTFLRLAEGDSLAARSREMGGRIPWGIILDRGGRLAPDSTVELLRAVGVDSVKWPLWESETDDETLVRGDAEVDRLLRMLHNTPIRVVGTLEAPTRSLSLLPNGRSRGLLDLLAAPPDEWRAWLVLPLARHGRQISACQVGSDTKPETTIDQRLLTSVAQVRAEVEPLLGRPDLATPVSPHMTVADELPADILSITMPAHLPAHRYEEYLGLPPSGARRWITILPLPEGRYDRGCRLAEFARRIVVAYAARPERVFVPQPWSIFQDGAVPVVELREETLVLRTLAAALRGKEPGPDLWLAADVVGRLFINRTDDTATLVAWVAGEPGSRRHVIVDLGERVNQIDLWGRVTRPAATATGLELALDETPLILAGAAAWRAELLSGLAIIPPTLQAMVPEQERTLRVLNPLNTPLRGELLLGIPGEWDVQPRKITLDVPPGQATEVRVRFRLPTNQAVGEYALSALLTVPDQVAGSVTLRTPVVVDSPGLDVNVLMDFDGRDLRVVQRVINRTAETLNLRTYLIAEEVPCDTQLISNLAVGQAATRQYLIPDARRLAGKHMRVAVQQLGGGLRNNQTFKLDPSD